jgi:dolichol-phosphate mannosyltransferase
LTDPTCCAVSIVVPVRNEVQSLPQLYRSIRESAVGLPGGREVVFVDDGSSDGSPEVLCELAESGGGRVTAVILRGRFGKSTALSAGFQVAQGELIITSRASWIS